MLRRFFIGHTRRAIVIASSRARVFSSLPQSEAAPILEKAPNDEVFEAHSKLVHPRELQFLLREFLDDLKKQGTQTEKDSQQIDDDTAWEMICAAHALAESTFAPINPLGDRDAPKIDRNRDAITHPPELVAAQTAYADAGYVGMRVAEEFGGLGLPLALATLVNLPFSCANTALMSYHGLTAGVATLLAHHGTPEQRRLWIPRLASGRCYGTMCLSESHAGSSLSDIRATASPRADNDGYDVSGAKMWITGGDHGFSESIVHMVLAKLPDAPPGARGISLFLVPKHLYDDPTDPDAPGTRNDVSLSGLNKKMGQIASTNAGELLFGDKTGAARGYLVGEPHRGLAAMFSMMNELRVVVGAGDQTSGVLLAWPLLSSSSSEIYESRFVTVVHCHVVACPIYSIPFLPEIGAAATGVAGYAAALRYARDRPQGRRVVESSPATKKGDATQEGMVPIVQHADVKRMLLASRAYAEGAVGLCLLAADLVDSVAEKKSPSDSDDDARLLDLLIPVVKSWPSEWGLEANKLAIQVHGGYGYTRDYVVEQLYRDARVNMIYEGTNGIQSLDLLGRKVPSENGRAVKILAARVREDIARASQTGRDRDDALLADLADRLDAALDAYLDATVTLLRQAADLDRFLANSHDYLQLTGHLVVGWVWLKQSILASDALHKHPESLSPLDDAFYRGKLHTALYFFTRDLANVKTLATLCSSLDDVNPSMRNEWFF